MAWEAILMKVAIAALENYEQIVRLISQASGKSEASVKEEVEKGKIARQQQLKAHHNTEWPGHSF